jgi:hypothetical protein
MYITRGFTAYWTFTFFISPMLIRLRTLNMMTQVLHALKGGFSFILGGFSLISNHVLRSSSLVHLHNTSLLDGCQLITVWRRYLFL